MTSDCIGDNSTDIEYVARSSDRSSFARLMDLKTVRADRGYALVQVRISAEKHLNFLGKTHGAVIFALADHACGLCGNSLGRKAVLVQSSITFSASPEPGTVIEAEAKMIHEGKTTGTIVIDVHTSNGEPLASCQSVVLFSNPEYSAP